MTAPLYPAQENEQHAPIRVALILSGIGRVARGAEAAFLELSRAWLKSPHMSVTFYGSGSEGLPDGADRHIIPCRPRERFEKWPSLPAFRAEGYYEECSFTYNLMRSKTYRPENHDIAVHCTYPWVNWYLRRANGKTGQTKLVYVTQNGDWPCHARQSEYKYFRCDGLVCTNLEYYERNRNHYQAALIPNGVDPELFYPPDLSLPREPIPEVDSEGLPRPGQGQPVVLIASALISSKRVAAGIEALGKIPDVFVVVAGDGPDRENVANLANSLLPGRHRLLGSIPRVRMPALFRRADVLLHMSQVEPSSLVYLEAASSGLGLVVHDCATTRWTLGDAVLYANTSDLEQTAAAVREAMAPGRRATLGAAARQRVLDGWTWSELANKYERFFRELMAKKR